MAHARRTMVPQHRRMTAQLHRDDQAPGTQPTPTHRHGQLITHCVYVLDMSVCVCVCVMLSHQHTLTVTLSSVWTAR